MWVTPFSQDRQKSSGASQSLGNSLARRAAAITIALTFSLLLTFSLSRAKAAAGSARGLVGHYYVSGPQISINNNDFQLPEPVTAPAATRVDAQIAFGQGSGFRIPPIGRHGATWGPMGSDFFGAAIWDGFIHLPKSGTYYFATVSQGSSAVYLNQARVALNGPASHYGRLLSSDNFTYDQADVQDFVQNVKGTPFGLRQDAYSLPVPVDGPRDLPIRIRYNGSDYGFIGIDLLWVTPDSPKDANGKPIAKLVPSDVLYTEAPGPIVSNVVRRANSTITSDLYCSGLQETKPLTLTFRLADKSGNPVAGKRVVFTTLSDDDFGFNDLVQPDKPTDNNGITTGKLKSRPDARPHASAIFAIDTTDLVDIAQVAHVRFPDLQPGFFISPCTTGYDPNVVTVEPQPLMVSRPVTVKTKLENRLKGDVDLYAIFQATDWNIGANTWKDIGRVDNIVLKPGEVKDVSVVWTPTAEQTHQCFKVRVGGTVKKASQGSGGGIMAAAMPSLALFDDQEKSDVYKILNHEPLYTAQHNFSNVAACDPRLMALYTLSGHGVMKSCFHAPEAGQMSGKPLPNMPPLAPTPIGSKGSPPIPNTNQGGGSTPIGGINPPPPDGQGGSEPGSSGPSAKTAATDLGSTVAYRYKVMCDQYAGHLLASPSQSPQSSSWGHWEQAYRECEKERIVWLHLSADPPAQQYRGLAVAQSDTVPAYVAAAQISMERYRAAQANGDADWMARHLKAMQLYLKHAADSERRAGDEEQKQADLAPAKDTDLAAAQAAVNDWTERAKHGGVPAEALAKLQAQGMSFEEAKSFVADLASYDQPLQLRDARSTLADSIALRRSTADQADQIVALSPDQGLAGESFMQTYNVVNPHDKQETVDLFIYPLSMSPTWKLYIANVMDPSEATSNSAEKPRYPVTEVQAGEHYAVTLPANTGVQLASVLVPGGDVGANTIARWAVGGRIGGDVIGTMVHEMIVPHIVADLTLPPIGSKEQMEEGSAPVSPNQSRVSLTAMIAFIAGIFVLLLLIVVWRRKRQAPAA